MISDLDQVSLIRQTETQHSQHTGVAADISHINTKSTVKGYDPTPSGLRECLSGAEIVLIPAGVPRKPGMTRDGMTLNSSSTMRLTSSRSLQHQCKHCP